MRIAVVIPAYNEGSHLAPVIKEAKNFVEEVVVVDDGSTDHTVEECRKVGVKVIIHKGNQGKGAAIISGVNYVKENNFEAVIFMDADGQHDPQEIPIFIDIYQKQKADIVLGNRLNDCKNMPFIRYATNRFTSFLVSFLAKQKIEDSQCGFRLFAVDKLRDLKLATRKFDTESEMLVLLSRRGCKVAAAPVKTIYREEESKINPVKDTIRFFKLIFSLWLKIRRENDNKE